MGANVWQRQQRRRALSSDLALPEGHWTLERRMTPYQFVSAYQPRLLAHRLRELLRLTPRLQPLTG